LRQKSGAGDDGVPQVYEYWLGLVPGVSKVKYEICWAEALRPGRASRAEVRRAANNRDCVGLAMVMVCPPELMGRELVIQIGPGPLQQLGAEGGDWLMGSEQISRRSVG
jgi:hypothetical protein